MSYLKTHLLQTSAADGAVRRAVDAKAVADMQGSLATGRVISGPEMQQRVLPRLQDGGPKPTPGEQPLVDLLEAASDDRRHVSIDGVRVRLTGPAKRAFAAYLESLRPPVVVLDEPAFTQAVQTALRAWYAHEVERVIDDLRVNDPETFATYTADMQSADRAAARRVVPAEPDSRTLPSFRPDEDIGFAWLDSAPRPTDESGNPLPDERLRFVRLDYEPTYAGQMVSSWFMFDRATGKMLRHLDTQA